MIVQPEVWRTFDVDEAFAKCVRGKRVIVIGPAASVVGCRRANTLAGYIIARMNNALPVPEYLHPDVGHKCDLLYHNGGFDKNPLDADTLRLAGVKFVCGQHNRADSPKLLESVTRTFVGWCLYNGFRLHFPGYKSYSKLSAKCGHPNGATSAIVDLLRHGAAEVATLGVDMFRSGYHPQYRSIHSPESAEESRAIISQWHDIERQKTYLRKLMNCEPRFKPGQDLKDAL